jgi:hypothetical protein
MDSMQCILGIAKKRTKNKHKYITMLTIGLQYNNVNYFEYMTTKQANNTHKKESYSYFRIILETSSVILAANNLL